MTAAEFEAIRSLLNQTKEHAEAARLVLVDGQSLQSVGEQFGCSRQAIFRRVSIFRKTFKSYRQAQQLIDSQADKMPQGWEKATFIAPSHLIAKFRAEIAQELPHGSDFLASSVEKKDPTPSGVGSKSQRRRNPKRAI